MELVLGKAASSALVLGFFALAIWFLRYLYGPGGKLRDPEWDRWNEQAEAERQKDADARSEADYEQVFLVYAQSFFGADDSVNRHLQLKIDHSFRVLKCARELAACEESLAPRQVRRPLVLAALFHDLGRFEQLVRYNTFADDLSCNHGLLGARLLHELGFLQAEEAPIRRQTMALVALHNRFAMPAPLPEERRLALAALRDADKLDILRVMAAHVRPGVPMDNVVMLNAVDEPKRCSPAIVAALEEGRTALYRDIRFVNDFRLVLCTWLHDLHFSTSLRLAAEGEFFPDILQGLAGVPKVQDKARALVEEKLGR